MTVRLADYVAQFLVDNDVTHCFTVTGGGAMHLNDALGHKDGLTCIYNHHEQACAIAAESYARLTNRIAAVCVTTGPGGTNAITGVMGGWVDSIPMLIISGQVRYDTMAKSTGLDIRAMGDQEFDIVSAVSSMTKYAVTVDNPSDIRFVLERAFHLAYSGRPGPCWIDIPLNVQAAQIEPELLPSYDPRLDDEALPPRVPRPTIAAIVEKLKEARRPVLNAGFGIRLSGGYSVFRELVENLKIPVVTGWDSIDLLPNDNRYYVGRAGIMGDRPGNWAVQNADLVISIGSRLSIRQVGYNWTTWAKNAYVIMEDVCADELRKPTLHVDMPVWADAHNLMEELVCCLDSDSPSSGSHEEWNEICQGWKEAYPVVLPKHTAPQRPANVYAFIGELSNLLKPGQVTVVGNGSACVVGSHAWNIKEGSRFLINSGAASMGYDIPAAIGAAVAELGDAALLCGETGDDFVCLVTGDGSIQMNIQELATVSFHRMPIKIFVINNGGYHSIRQTQNNVFGGNLCGIGPESGDLGFPDMEKLSDAYGIPFFRCGDNDEIAPAIKKTIDCPGPALCEIVVSASQVFEPKSATKRMEDGSLYSPPLEDLAPFLPREELETVMSVSRDSR